MAGAGTIIPSYVPTCVDPVAAEFFAEQQRHPPNRICFDTGNENPQWASVSHGIYLSIEAAGLHRGFGVNVSFVQSTTLDAWKPVHLRMMELGGNEKLNDFLRQHGIDEKMPTQEKYATRAAKWYRENLRAVAEGSTPPEPLVPGTGHLPAISSSSVALTEQDMQGASMQQSRIIGGKTGLAEPRSRGSLCQKASRCVKAAWAVVAGAEEPLTSRSSTSGDADVSSTYGSQHAADVQPKLATYVATSNAADSIQNRAGNCALLAAAAAAA